MVPGGNGGGSIVVRAFALMSITSITALPLSVSGTCIISLIVFIPPSCLLPRLSRSCVDLTIAELLHVLCCSVHVQLFFFL